MSAGPPGDQAPGTRGLGLLVAALIGLVFLWRLGLAEGMRFGPDEMEHLHASWSLSKGLMIYRDFFEHHPPALYFALAPTFWLVDVETTFESAWSLMLGLRGMMWLVSLVAVWLVWKLGCEWRGPQAGTIAASLIAFDALFVDKSTEIRPDGPGLVMLLLSWIALLMATRAKPGSGTAARLFAGSGAALSLGVLFTQKQLFLWPAAALTLVHYMARHRWSREGMKGSLAFVVGVLAPLALVGLVFLHLGGLHDLLYYTLQLNAGWKAQRGPLESLPEIVGESPFLWAFGLLALLVEIARLGVRRIGVESAAIIMVANLVFALVGLWILPVVYRQAFLPVNVLLAVAAGGGIARLLAASEALAPGAWRPRAALVAAAVLGPVLPLALGSDSRWSACLPIAAMIVLAFRSSRLAAPLLAASIALDAVAPLHHLERRINKRRIAEMRLVYLNSAPCDVALDGFSGSAPFRPHASPYFFVHWEIQEVLGPAARAAMAARLQPSSAPQVIILDSPLRKLEPKLEDLVARHYVIAGDEPLVYVPLFDLGLGTWDDSAPRSLARTSCDRQRGSAHVILGEGWLRRTEESHGFLQVADRRARLWLPLVTPADGTLTLRVRTEGNGTSNRLRIRVNDLPTGLVPVGADWQEQSLLIPAAMLKSGANEVVLRTLGEQTPGVQVDWVRFVGGGR